MGNKQQMPAEMPTAENEARSLIKSNFRRIKSASSVTHVYDLSTLLIDSERKCISAANLPAVLRAVEDNEREQPSAENIRLWLGNSG